MLGSLSRATSLHLGARAAFKWTHVVVRYCSTLPSVSELAEMDLEEVDQVMDERGSSGMTLEWTKGLGSHMMSLKPLPKPIVMHVLKRAKTLFQQQDNVLELQCCCGEKDQPSKLTVCGDTHGQFWDVMNLFSDKVAGFPSPSNPYLFNGDMVDRGIYSFEVIFTLLAIKVASPASVEILRGNHETSDMNAIYGFEKQVLAAYDSEVLRAVRDVFKNLPIGATINQKVFIVHGGLGKETHKMSIAEINRLDRFVDSPRFTSALSELLWSDPSDEITGLSMNKQRGAGWIFGKLASQSFLQKNQLELIVRSHEVRMNGFSVHHDGLCVTVFSAPNYCDRVGNLGAVLQFTAREADGGHLEDALDADGTETSRVELSVLQFKAVPHPYLKLVDDVGK